MISVIIPVFNAEKYICRCINSIIAQTNDNWEIISVDDGSTDNSLSILRRFEKDNSKIKVFHQQNRGAGAARNLGIKKASGDYIVFVDADDYIESDYFSLLSAHNEDVVFIDINRRNENGQVVCIEKMSIHKKKQKDEIIREQMTGKILWGGCRKAVRASLLKEHSICYSGQQVGEEAIYSFKLLHYATTISFIEKSVYNYEVHSGSLSQMKIDDPWGEVAIEMRNSIIEMGLYDIYASTINSFLVSAAIVSLDKMAGNYTGTRYREKAEERVKKFLQERDRKYSVDFQHMPAKAKVLYPFLKIGWVFPVYVASRIYRARR